MPHPTLFHGLGSLLEYCPLWLSRSSEQVPSAVGPDLLHPALLRARVKVALTGSDGEDTNDEAEDRVQQYAGL